MINLKQSLSAWGTATFKEVLKDELEQLKAEELPLQQGLSLSSYVSAEPFKVMVINVADDESMIRVKAGIFFTGIIAGCSCSDDPSPTDVQPEYCEVRFEINKQSAATAVVLLPQ
ncbi:MAG: hypothetical protein ABFS08_03280 [Pseudomonadota bacterium]